MAESSETGNTDQLVTERIDILKGYLERLKEREGERIDRLLAVLDHPKEPITLSKLLGFYQQEVIPTFDDMDSELQGVRAQWNQQSHKIAQELREGMDARHSNQ